jgi:ferredoxin
LKEEDKKYLEINDRLSKMWPLITEAKPAPEDAKEWENKPDKLKLLEE